MTIVRAANIDNAIRYAQVLQAEGECDFFRGQVRRWPMVPTLLRLTPEAAQDAKGRMERFLDWLEGTTMARQMRPDLASRIAVAQHYGLPTRLLDVSRDPRIAGFLASHTGSPPKDATESCLFCFHSARFGRAMEALRRKAVADGFNEEGVDLPFLLDIDVRNLWRLPIVAINGSPEVNGTSARVPTISFVVNGVDSQTIVRHIDTLPESASGTFTRGGSSSTSTSRATTVSCASPWCTTPRS